MSTLNVANITDGTDTVATGYVVNGSAKAWLNLQSTTNTIQGSLNVSSVVDNATGDFASNLTSSMNDIHYSIAASNIGDTQASFAVCITSSRDANTVGKYEFQCRNTVGDSINDVTVANTVIHGDLA